MAMGRGGSVGGVFYEEASDAVGGVLGDFAVIDDGDFAFGAAVIPNKNQLLAWCPPWENV